MNELRETEMWLKSIFNINKEINFERELVMVAIKRIAELQKQKEEVLNVIENVKNPVHKTILHKRYVQGKKWEDVSKELCYEQQHIHRLHKKAVEEVCKIQKEQE